MKIQKKHWLIPAIAAAPFIALITCILQSISLFSEYDADRAYFSADAPVHTAVTVLLAVGLVFFIGFAIGMRRELSTPSYAGTLSVLFSATLTCVSLTVFVIFTVIASMNVTGLSAALMILGAIAGCVSIVYFAWFLFPVPAQTATRGMLGLSFSFFCLLAALVLYFDLSEQMNAPAKLLSLLAFAILACYALTESRGLFGRGSPALQYLLTSLGLTLSLTASVPNILFTLVRGQELVLSTVYDFVLLAFGLYLFSRLLQMLPRELPMTHPLIRVFLRDDDEELTTNAGSEDENRDEEEAEDKTDAEVREN